MAEDKKIILTIDGLKKLEDELQNLKVVRRKDVAEKIKEARSQGDLSENAEYDAAKEEQAEIEARIVVIEKMLRNAEIIDEEDINTGSVNLGNKIKLKNTATKAVVEYTLVGSAESDPVNGLISNECPMGVALIGHKVGDTVEVNAPNGVLKFKIMDIN